MSQVAPYALSPAALATHHQELPGWEEPCSTSGSAVTLCGEGNPAKGTDGGSPHRRHPTLGMEVAVVAAAKPGPTGGSNAIPATVCSHTRAVLAFISVSARKYQGL